ncbi:hypothetical protein D5S17_14580 [Pseudonocardiaceae bacterium YIM PH 21723]|nr:hypothetical protein D5S17_14580 [Pseudonocardiaceae bacterium YIM PH 21723]
MNPRLRHLWEQVIQFWHDHQLPIALTASLVLAITMSILRNRQIARREWHHCARVLEVLPPADLTVRDTLHGAQRLWRDLHATTRSRLQRFLEGHPPLALEFWLLPGEIHARLWIPGTIPAGRAEAALRAAWPGCSIEQIPEDALSPQATTVGGTVGLHRAEQFPLDLAMSTVDAEVYRPWEALAAGLDRNECAVIQVLTRPAAGHRLRRYRTAVQRLNAGRQASSNVVLSALNSVVRELMDIITGHGPSTPKTRAAGQWRARSPQETALLRQVNLKASGQLWETSIRYTVASSNRGRQTRARLSGHTDTLFGVFAQFSSHNSLTRRRTRNPRAVLATRRLRRGVLLSIDELAALAHLPTRTPALVDYRARSIAAPAAATTSIEKEPR